MITQHCMDSCSLVQMFEPSLPLQEINQLHIALFILRARINITSLGYLSITYDGSFTAKILPLPTPRQKMCVSETSNPQSKHPRFIFLIIDVK